MHRSRYIFYSLTALLAVLVFMVYYDMVVFYASDFFRPWYYDMIEHFIGGVIVAGLAIHYAYIRAVDLFPKKFWIALLMVMAFVSLVAVVWEFFEFVSNIAGGAPQNTLPDTVKDIAMGLLGSVVGSLILLPGALKK